MNLEYTKQLVLIIWITLFFLGRTENIYGNLLKDKVSVTINTNNIIATGISNKFGLTLNAGIDVDANRPAGSRALTEAINDTGAKHLRYPGGKKSLYYFWAAYPYKDLHHITGLRVDMPIMQKTPLVLINLCPSANKQMQCPI